MDDLDRDRIELAALMARAPAPNQALRLDAAWLKTFATPQQRALLAGRDVRQPPATMWADSDDARQRLRDERHAMLRAREGEPL